MLQYNRPWKIDNQRTNPRINSCILITRIGIGFISTGNNVNTSIFAKRPDRRLFSPITTGLPKKVNILPKLLYGSRRLTSKTVPKTNERIVTTRIPYLSLFQAFVKLKYRFLFFLNFFTVQDITSCMIPRGQTEEQYTLPNTRVRTITTRKPAAPKVNTLKNFNNEGINCSQVTVLIADSGMILRKSRKVRIKATRKTNETTTLPFFNALVVTVFKLLSCQY